MKSMRILYAVNGYKPAYRIGGAVVAVSGYAENLVKRGHKVVVFTSNANLDEELDVAVNQPVMVNGVEVWYFERKELLKKYFPFIPYLSQSMGYLYSPLMKGVLSKRISDFDLVHTHMPFIYPTQVVANMGISHGIPTFYQQHGAFAPAYMNFRSIKKQIYISLVEKPIMKKATSLIALTEAEICSYQNLGINTPCRIVTNGINVNEYIQETGSTLSLSEQFHIKPENFVILFLSRLHSIKGVDFLLDVFLQIFNESPNLQLVLAGPDQHDYSKSLISKVKAAGASEKVWIPGMVTGNLKQNLLARADLFCQPSMAEGFSISILEAMASARPVLITPECNFSELEEKSAGWIVEKNQQKWIEKITNIIENRSQLRSTGENALKLVRNHYTWEKTVERLEEVYSEGLQRASMKS